MSYNDLLKWVRFLTSERENNIIDNKTHTALCKLLLSIYASEKIDKTLTDFFNSNLNKAIKNI